MTPPEWGDVSGRRDDIERAWREYLRNDFASHGTIGMPWPRPPSEKPPPPPPSTSDPGWGHKPPPDPGRDMFTEGLTFANMPDILWPILGFVGLALYFAVLR